MNNVFTAKLLQNLNNKKGNKGFTLIELLVVVIIIGVLAAVALPNLLSQVGKARETEAKNAMGTINRTQQSYHFEKQLFSPKLDNTALKANNVLGVIVASKYFDLNTSTNLAAATDPGDPTTALSTASSNDGQTGKKDGVRNYAAGIGFNSGSSQYNSVLCQNDTVGAASVAAITTGGTAASTSNPECGTGSTAVK